MRSLLILATLALVCFVDKNSAAAVRRDFNTPSTDSSITTAGSSTNAQTNPGTIAVAVTPKTGIENSGPALEENNKGNAPNTVTAAPAPEPTVTPEPTDAPKTAPPASAPPASSAPSPNAPAPNAPSVAATATADVHSGN